MKKLYVFLMCVYLFITYSFAQNPLPITSLQVAYTQNFDSLGSAGTIDSVLVTGWQFAESGTNANRSYAVNDGTGNGGNTYSYGVTASRERAFGSLASTSLLSNYGGYFINQTGQVITGVNIQFVMEQWRAGGNRTAPDSSEFFYGINNGGFATGNGTWTKFSNLNLTSKVLGGFGRGLIGNDTANQKNYSVFIPGLTLNPNDTLFISWRDINVAGNDDGLAIDNFSITAYAGGSIPNPNPLYTLSFTSPNSKSALVSYTRIGYVASGMTTLVFIKPDSAIIQGTPSTHPTRYNSSTDFSVSSSTYEHDANAKCVYNGDATSFTVTGLSANTTYHLLVYNVRDVDSMYSTSTVANTTTLGNPMQVSAATFLAESQTTATLSWTKNSDYINTSHTTLVFVKGDPATISSVVPVSTPTYYTANANYTGGGTKFENDTLAVCVYKGDATSVLVSGLSQNSNYQFVVFTYRESDSLYSTATTGSGKTLDKNIPASLTALFVNQITASIATVNWTKPTGYANDTHQVLVFMKAMNPISDSSVHTTNPASYTGNANFASATSSFEHDSNAFCVYSGDGNNINITGLNAQTTYYVIAYVVRFADSSYSNVRTTNFVTPAPPAPAPDPATNIGFVQTALRSGRISWNKPSNYVNSTHTTLVFVKRGANLQTGTPVKSPLRYTANPNLGVGTAYDFDTATYCVYRADTTFITVNNLPATGDISIVIHVVRDADSVYATPATGTALMQIPTLRNIGSVNKTNMSTGQGDSNGVYVHVYGTVAGFNQRTTGLLFLLTDGTEGISISSTGRTFGYTVKEGDTLHAVGLIGSIRGLCIVSADSVWGGSSLLSAPTPQPVTDLNETTENKIVKVNMPLHFVTPPAGGVWPTANTSIPVINSANDTFTVRLLTTSGLAGKPLPTSRYFNVSGMGGQQSSSLFVPFAFDGYTIIPRYESDITVLGDLDTFRLVTPIQNSTVTLNEPLTDIVRFDWRKSTPNGTLSAPTYLVQFDTVSNFINPYFEIDSDNFGTDTSLSPTKQDILDYLLGIGYAPGQTVAASWRVIATSAYASRISLPVFSINFVLPFNSGLDKNEFGHSVKMYPNPANHLVQVRATEALVSIELMSISGQSILLDKPNTYTYELNVSGLTKGIYFVKLQSVSGSTAIKKLNIQ